MLVLKRTVGESLILVFPEEWCCEPVTVTVLGGNKLGIEAEESITILRAELMES